MGKVDMELGNWRTRIGTLHWAACPASTTGDDPGRTWPCWFGGQICACGKVAVLTDAPPRCPQTAWPIQSRCTGGDQAAGFLPRRRIQPQAKREVLDNFPASATGVLDGEELLAAVLEINR